MDSQDLTFDYLLPDYNDDPSEILISFPEIKRQTTQALYSKKEEHTLSENPYHAIDKSPKGSVDEPIQPLVDLINHHPSFSTLSSCSGRIALFEPSGSSGTAPVREPADISAGGVERDTNTRDLGTPESGKGRGGWLLVSHEIIDVSALQKIFDEHTDGSAEMAALQHDIEKALMFKLEPMLLHVAAATMDRGKQLLNLALNLGFRESGIVVPNKRNHRVTVAIRGVSLALTVPLGFQGPLRPSKEYLKALVDQANNRLHRNQTKIQKLYESVKANFYQKHAPTTGMLESCHKPLPDLNLWGHDIVAVTHGERGSRDVDILVFGGYGTGPDIEKSNANKQCQRSGDVYYLRRSGGVWVNYWGKIAQREVSDDEMQITTRLDSLGADVRRSRFTPRGGLAVFRTLKNNIVGIWGGRKGPNKPLDDFLLYEYLDQSQPSCFWTPVDIRGEKPAPRWGHTLTSLDSISYTTHKNLIRLALLIGGRNERTTLGTVHLLSLVQDDSPGGGAPAHFLWETVSFSPQLQRPVIPFHHSTVSISQERNTISIFVFGGSSMPNSLLDSFAPFDDASSSTKAGTPESPSDSVASSYSLQLDSKDVCLSALTVVKHPTTSTAFHFGGAVTPVKGLRNEKGGDRNLILLSGGVPREEQQSIDSSPLQLVELCRATDGDSTSSEAWYLQPCELSGSSSGNLTEAVLVHHRALAVPSYDRDQEEVLLLGGGVMGFSFGPCFSKSFVAQILPKVPQRRAEVQVAKPNPANAAPKNNGGEGPPRQTSTNVLYVKKQNAKALKTALERLSVLDKAFRMTPSTNSKDMIAVPVVKACLPLLSSESQKDGSSYEFVALVEGMGEEPMPYSTARFAKQAK